MKPEAQRIAIAEACGLNPQDLPFVPAKANLHGYFTPEASEELHRAYPNCVAVKIIPDYLNDLNAMHEAEGTLSPTLIETYHTWVNFVVVRDSPNVEPQHLPFTLARYRWHATAAQRAEAFLKCLGKWVE